MPGSSNWAFLSRFTQTSLMTWELIIMSLCRIRSLALADLFGSWLAMKAYNQTFVSMKATIGLLVLLIELFSCERREAFNPQGIVQEVFYHVEPFSNSL